MATLKKKLEEAQRLKDQAEKAKAKVEKAIVEVEKAKEEAEQHSYDIGVAETEDTLRAEVRVVCLDTVLRLGRKLSTELGLRFLLS